MGDRVQLQQRDPQPYAGIAVSVTMDSFAATVDEAFPEVFGWLAEHAIAPAGPPFIRYHVIDMAATLQIEFGVPVAAAIVDDGRIRSGVLPAGRYLVLRHVGPFEGLIEANAALQQWAEEQGIALDSWDTPEGVAFRSRVEHYLTDPTAEPDPARWETEVAYLAADS
jgi:effector-binding domain-containing protein